MTNALLVGVGAIGLYRFALLTKRKHAADFHLLLAPLFVLYLGFSDVWVSLIGFGSFLLTVAAGLAGTVAFGRLQSFWSLDQYLPRDWKETILLLFVVTIVIGIVMQFE